MLQIVLCVGISHCFPPTRLFSFVYLYHILNPKIFALLKAHKVHGASFVIHVFLMLSASSPEMVKHINASL